MKNHLALIFSLTLLLSCSQSETEQAVSDTVEIDPTEMESRIDTENDMAEEVESSAFIELSFTGLTLIIEYIEMGWDDMDSYDDRTCEADTIAYFNLYPGDWMDNKTFEILESEYDEIEIHVQEVVEVSLTTDRPIEVPFCVISNWKKSTSDWIKIEQESAKLSFGSIPDFNTNPIVYNAEELKKAVKASCGDEWYEDVRNIDNHEDLPSSEFTSQYTYKIIARNSITGKTIERLLVFYPPTSC